MLRMRPRTPSIGPMLRCRPFISKSLRCSKRSPISTTRSLSNQGIPPQGPPQYSSQVPPPQYFPQQPQQPLPQYFPKPTEEPSSASSKFFRTLFVFLLGAFVGHNVEQEPHTGKWTFICIPAQFYLRLGDAKFLARRTLIEQWAKKHDLGEIKGMPIMEGDKDYSPNSEPKVVYPEQIHAWRIEQERNPTPELERELAIHDMFGIISRLLHQSDFQNRPWGFGFWHATNGDYSQFRQVSPLVEMLGPRQSIAHVDALKLMGSEDYFAFVAARSIADGAVFHDAERATAQLLTYAVPTLVGLFTIKQSASRVLLKVITSWIAMDKLFYPWICRRTDRANDEIALGMLVSGGFDPKAAIGALQRIEELEKRDKLPYESALPEYMQQRASIASRIENIEELLPSAIERQEELNKAREMFEKLAAAQQEDQERELRERSSVLPSPGEEKKDDDKSNPE